MPTSVKSKAATVTRRASEPKKIDIDSPGTFGMPKAANVWNAGLYDKLGFDFIRDIAPVASISRTPGVIAVTLSFPAKTVPELIAYAKVNPGKINMASGGIGSLPHVARELFKFLTGVDMVHVPYRGSYLPDLLGGQVQVAFGPIPTLIEQIRAGKLRPLALTGASPSAALPNISTVGEFVPGYEASAFNGVGAPKGTPIEIIAKLNNAINAAPQPHPVVRPALGKEKAQGQHHRHFASWERQ
jgi:tripartite-type tricarboxylate transporter receptor subunit TctC